MISLEIRRLDEEMPLPGGNPLKLYVSDYSKLYVPTSNYDGKQWFYEVFTGLEIQLPDDLEMRVQTHDGYVLGHRMDKEKGLVVCVTSSPPDEGEHFATATIIHAEKAKVRFLEVVKGGGRMRTGDAKPVEDSGEISDTEPGS